MDHWGDPWADNNAEEDKSPIKHEITSPLPPSQTSGPGLLNGFLDDAGWGNEDASFGDWATASAPETQTSIATELRAQDLRPSGSYEEPSGYTQWATEGETCTRLGHDGADWLGTPDGPENLDNERSETSGSSTTVQPDDVTEPVVTDISQTSPTDDTSSARASTSPSETSHNDAPIESPRTSIEEEQSGDIHALDLDRNRDQPSEGHNDVAKTVFKSEIVTREAYEGGTQVSTEAPDTYRTLDQTDTERELVNNAFEDFSDLKSTRRPTIPFFTHNGADAPVRAEPFPIDPTLLDQLFPTVQQQKEVDEAPDDPIYSTAGRKAWYRLTRKQTMREYNSGAVDDNHVRVNWISSQIKADVNKVVGRWAREDRISGTGPGARASFYWDTPASVDPAPVSKHSRTLSTVPAPRAAALVRQSLPPIPTNTPAAFNWSSPTTSVDPWNQSSVIASIPPPITSPYSAMENLQGKTHALSSADFMSPKLEQTTQKRTLTPVAETPAVTSLISPPPPNTTIAPTDPWNGFETFDTDKTSHSALATESFDDDDDWGEMVSTPTVSTPTTESMSQSTTRNNTLSTLSSAPYSVKAPPVKDESADAMHASPIVRLKSTISPTSAIFGAKSFVPLHVEQGPIGPGLLKPANRSVSNSSKTNQIEVQSFSIPTGDKPQEKAVLTDKPVDIFAQTVAPTEVVPEQTSEHDTSFDLAFTTLTPEPPKSFTPPPATIPIQTSTDSWADADFSFFESAAPAPAQSTPDSSNPFSVFETPQLSASAAKPFTRSPPRTLTPPPLQPLTGATNSAQRRKEEEDEVLRDILSGLPDLRYMLR